MRVFVKLATLGLLLTSALPALAQSGEPMDKRVGTLESQMKAVQRKVFPGGDKKFFEPEFPATDPSAPAVTTGAPATSPLADLTTRVDALERQLQTLTGQVEQATFKARQNEEAMTKLRADTEYRLGALEGTNKPVADATVPLAADEVPAPPKPVAKLPVKAPAKTPPKPVAAPVGVPDDDVTAGTTDAMPSAKSAAPKSTDPAEASFQSAYALVMAKKYDEAETALQAFLKKYPASARASHAQYWLGRTYMAEKMPAQAAKAYLENYKNMPKGARAPDSLLGLGGALMALSPPQAEKACEVYGELDAVYAAKLTTDQKAQLTRGRATAKCKS